MTELIGEFRLPRYREIPTIGLYLEQITRYINEALAFLEETELTASMISNYVKKGYVPRPEKKQYYPQQIACLLFLAAAKQVLPMDDAARLLKLMQRDSIADAYDGFCEELELALRATFSDAEIEPLPADAQLEARIRRSLVTAAAHVCYLRHSLGELPDESEN